MKKTAFNLFVCFIVFSLIVLFNFLDIGFSTVFYILLSGLFGLFIYLITELISKKKAKEDKKDVT